MSESNGRLRVGSGIALQIIVYVIVVVLAYAALDRRIAVLEAKYDRIASDLTEIKSDLKRLLQKP